MAVDSVAVHHPEQPESFDTREVLNDKLAVLIGFLHIWYHAHARLGVVFLHYAPNRHPKLLLLIASHHWEDSRFILIRARSSIYPRGLFMCIFID